MTGVIARFFIALCALLVAFTSQSEAHVDGAKNCPSADDTDRVVTSPIGDASYVINPTFPGRQKNFVLDIEAEIEEEEDDEWTLAHKLDTSSHYFTVIFSTTIPAAYFSQAGYRSSVEDRFTAFPSVNSLHLTLRVIRI